MNAQLTNNALDGLSASAIAQVDAANKALRSRRMEDAEQHVRAALAQAPEHPELLHMLAFVYDKRERYNEAIQLLQRAMVQRPRDARILITLGNVLINSGLMDDGVAALKHACALAPNLPLAWFNLAVVLKSRGEYDAAIDALNKVLVLAPGHEDAKKILADVLKDHGRFDEARAAYRDILARDPNNGTVWAGLANIKSVSLSEQDLKRINRAIDDQRTGVKDRVPLYFALAKGLEDAKRYPEAFAAFEKGNSLIESITVPWNADAFDAKIDSMINDFSGPQADSDFGKEAIFIVSMPRSGSTLTEQILASHPLVEGGDELKDLLAVINEQTHRLQGPLSQWGPTLSRDEWRRIGQEYLDRTAHWRARRPMFTNKLPGNWLFIGVILAMLPGAKIVACRRDPVETCFACFRQLMTGNNYTHRFDTMARTWLGFDRAVRHWSTQFPRNVREQVYEDLLEDPERQTRALLDFCGLEFDERCMRFYETQRQVRTPSATQVREPLRRDTARSTRYGALLDPLRIALGRPPMESSPQA